MFFQLLLPVSPSTRDTTRDTPRYPPHSPPLPTPSPCEHAPPLLHSPLLLPSFLASTPFRTGVVSSFVSLIIIKVIDHPHDVASPATAHPLHRQHARHRLLCRLAHQHHAHAPLSLHAKPPRLSAGQIPRRTSWPMLPSLCPSISNAAVIRSSCTRRSTK